MRTVITVAIDCYDEGGNLMGSTVGARCSGELHDPHDAIDTLFTNLPQGWRQLTYAEALDMLSERRTIDTATWEQLSIF